MKLKSILVVLMGSLVIGAACQSVNKSGTGVNQPSQDIVEVTSNSTIDASPAETPTPTPVATPQTSVSTKPLNPSYLEESEYEGDELAIVQIINARVKYLWEGNEEEYLKLILENSPLTGFPAYQIEKVELRSDISIQEQKYVFQAVVGTVEYRDKGEDFSNMYVLLKNKEKGAVWKILDID